MTYSFCVMLTLNYTAHCRRHIEDTYFSKLHMPSCIIVTLLANCYGVFVHFVSFSLCSVYKMISYIILYILISTKIVIYYINNFSWYQYIQRERLEPLKDMTRLYNSFMRAVVQNSRRIIYGRWPVKRGTAIIMFTFAGCRHVGCVVHTRPLRGCRIPAFRCVIGYLYVYTAHK